jgi:SPP1 family predicted phage head-tail adaptor
MRAGELRHRAYFDNRSTTLDSDGERTEDWEPAFGGIALQVRLKALSGRELIAAAAVQSKVSTEIRARYRSGFSPSMRVRCDGDTFNIEAVIPDPVSRREWVTLLCSHGANLG